MISLQVKTPTLKDPPHHNTPCQPPYNWIKFSWCSVVIQLVIQSCGMLKRSGEKCGVKISEDKN